MENTTAFSTLIDMISFIGSFITTPIFFGLSVLNILFISFILTHIIAVCIGGFPDRTRNVRVVNGFDKAKANKDSKTPQYIDVTIDGVTSKERLR